MTKIYACLAGNWVCLNDDPECTISEWRKSPYCWWEEGAPLYAAAKRPKEIENSMYCMDYVIIFYQGKVWRINPTFIQIVTE